MKSRSINDIVDEEWKEWEEKMMKWKKIKLIYLLETILKQNEGFKLWIKLHVVNKKTRHRRRRTIRL